MTDRNDRLAVIETQLKENLQTLYRQVLDADQRLDQLTKSGQGKFSAILDDEHFTTQARRFRPYWNEVAANVADLDFSQAEDALNESLRKVVEQLALLTRLLQTFNQNAR